MNPKTYISKVAFPGVDKGTKFFLQDGLYYYKTRTEMDAWLSKEDVEENKGVFELVEDDLTSIYKLSVSKTQIEIAC